MAQAEHVKSKHSLQPDCSVAQWQAYRRDETPAARPLSELHICTPPPLLFPQHRRIDRQGQALETFLQGFFQNFGAAISGTNRAG
jgi:hypothetical protein